MAASKSNTKHSDILPQTRLAKSFLINLLKDFCPWFEWGPLGFPLKISHLQVGPFNHTLFMYSSTSADQDPETSATIALYSVSEESDTPDYRQDGFCMHVLKVLTMRFTMVENELLILDLYSVLASSLYRQGLAKIRMSSFVDGLPWPIHL